MANETIYLGNLPYGVTEAELLALCEPFGTVIHIKMPKDFDTGQGRGFAFVSFDTVGDAFKCVMKLDGIEFQGRVLKAALAKPKTEQRR